MSGSGGGGGGGSRFDATPGGTPTPDCAALVIQTPLNSAVPAVVATLKKDTRLAVRKATAPGGIVRIEVVAAAGKVAGAVTSAQMMKLIECIDSGFEFVAVVTNDPSGGLVNLRIQAASRP